MELIELDIPDFEALKRPLELSPALPGFGGCGVENRGHG